MLGVPWTTWVLGWYAMTKCSAAVTAATGTHYGAKTVTSMAQVFHSAAVHPPPPTPSVVQAIEHGRKDMHKFCAAAAATPSTS